MWVLTGKVAREKQPLQVNDSHWGLSKDHLPEAIAVAAEWDRESREGRSVLPADWQQDRCAFPQRRRRLRRRRRSCPVSKLPFGFAWTGSSTTPRSSSRA